MNRSTKILILRLSAIGDIILVSPLLRALRRRHPNASIDFVVKEEFADLVRYNPHLDTVHLVSAAAGLRGLVRLGRELHRRRYDLWLDLHRNFRTAVLARSAAARRVARYRKYRLRRWLLVHFKIDTMQSLPPVTERYRLAAAALQLSEDGEGPELFWTPQHEQEAEQCLWQAGWRPSHPLLALAPGAGFATKRWPVENFVALANSLLQRLPDHRLAILGGPQDMELGGYLRQQAGSHVLDLTGRCSLLASAAVIKRSRILVANDSGLMHMGEAVRTPVLALFGSTTRQLGFFPQRYTSRVLENAGLACRPCSHLGYDACPRGHFRCMQEIAPGRALTAATALLASAQAVARGAAEV